MEKDRLNKLIRQYVGDNLKLTKDDRRFISSIYIAVQKALGSNSTLQIGSYPRGTSIVPLNDLDLLFVTGEWGEGEVPNPKNELENLREVLINNFENPTPYKVEFIPPQTHSISMVFLEGDKEIFSVDVVPAYTYTKNSYGEDMYKVPEIIKQTHKQRNEFYSTLKTSGREMEWISTDPRGYITQTSNLKDLSPDFLTTVMFLKKWKSACKESNKLFKFKSFHIEQILYRDFSEKPTTSIFDAIFKFMTNLTITLSEPQFPDRADSGLYIDSYVAEEEFRSELLGLILEARDKFMDALENLSEDDSIEELVSGDLFLERYATEEFLFDRCISTLIDNSLKIGVRGKLRDYKDLEAYSAPMELKLGGIDIGENIRFEIRSEFDLSNYRVLWKIKNDSRAEKPRGEIKESGIICEGNYVAYEGAHFVEAYLIQNGICVAKSRLGIKVSRRKY